LLIFRVGDKGTANRANGRRSICKSIDYVKEDGGRRRIYFGIRRTLYPQTAAVPATISARILPNVESEEKVLNIQLIENLQRREIDPFSLIRQDQSMFI